RWAGARWQRSRQGPSRCSLLTYRLLLGLRLSRFRGRRDGLVALLLELPLGLQPSARVLLGPLARESRFDLLVGELVALSGHHGPLVPADDVRLVVDVPTGVLRHQGSSVARADLASARGRELAKVFDGPVFVAEWVAVAERWPGRESLLRRRVATLE